ncbi:hypothetical protein T492DRAFT_888442 [Pavlovales sp. CCMP2436]|nr:hypothetical protein T492DRAFT_888442 [Pavlovales sp. CCMP2436]
MAKRMAVLQKEQKILREVATRTDLAKTLPAIGVVTRAAKRLSARDKAKERTLAAKELQVSELRKEAEEVRRTLFDENQALKEPEGIRA